MNSIRGRAPKGLHMIEKGSLTETTGVAVDEPIGQEGCSVTGGTPSISQGV